MTFANLQKQDEKRNKWSKSWKEKNQEAAPEENSRKTPRTADTPVAGKVNRWWWFYKADI